MGLRHAIVASVALHLLGVMALSRLAPRYCQILARRPGRVVIDLTPNPRGHVERSIPPATGGRAGRSASATTPAMPESLRPVPSPGGRGALSSPTSQTAGDAYAASRTPGLGQLFDRAAIARAAGVTAGPASHPTQVDRAEDAQSRVRSFVDETEGRYRVEAGAVDPWLYDAARDATRYFRPRLQDLALARTVATRDVLTAPAAIAPVVGRTSRWDHDTPVAPDAYQRFYGADSQMLEVQHHTATDQPEVGVLVAVTLDSSGVVVSLSILASSGVDEVDREALGAITAAIAAREPHRAGRRLETRWLCTTTLDGERTSVELVSVLPR